MNKLLTIFAVLFLLAPASVFAWHCEDTDEATPQWDGNPFGNWGDDGKLGGTTWGWKDLGVTLPKGCDMTGTNTGTCADLCIDFTLREFSCEDRPNFPGESVITWMDYENSQQCGGNEVPEFGAVALVALLGLSGVFIYKRRN